MPWTKIEDVPDKVRKHKGAPLTIEQANKWGEIYDAVKQNENISQPAAVAWSTWEEVYELKDGAWIARKREKAEAMLLVEEIATVESITESEDGLPGRAKVVLIGAGPCKTKNREYSKAALQTAVAEGVFENMQMFDAHPPGSEQVPGATQSPRKVSELMSYVMPGTVRFDDSVVNPITKTAMGGVVAEAELVDEGFRKSFKRKAKIIGPSVNSICDAVYQAGKEVVTRIRRGISADWVTKPNAGGMVLEVVEAAEDPSSNPGGKEGTQMPVLNEWSELTVDMIKANRADLWEEAKRVAASDEQWLKSAAESLIKQAVDAAKTATNSETQAAKTEATAAKAEAEEAKAKLAANEKEMAENQAQANSAAAMAKLAGLVDSKCGSLNILAKGQVMQAVIGKTFANDKDMAEAIDIEVAKLPKPSQHPAKPASDGGVEPNLPSGTREYAENIGFTPDEVKKLAAVRP